MIAVAPFSDIFPTSHVRREPLNEKQEVKIARGFNSKLKCAFLFLKQRFLKHNEPALGAATCGSDTYIACCFLTINLKIARLPGAGILYYLAKFIEENFYCTLIKFLH